MKRRKKQLNACNKDREIGLLLPQYRRTTIAVFLFAAVFFGIMGVISAWAIEISQTPMARKIMPAPANIMFILDNSGSMDWEMMVAGQANGTFPGPDGGYTYVFSDPGDNNYGPTSWWGNSVQDLNPGLWKAQWSGYNRMYYNPEVNYQPWPGMQDVDIDNDLTQVRSNPYRAGDTFDLTAQYQQVAARIETEVIVDNLDPEFSKSDDADPAPADAPHWASASYDNQWGTDYYYSQPTDAEGNAWARWTPDLPQAGTYEVFAWYRTLESRRDDVTYDILHDGSTTTVSTIGNEAGGTQISHNSDDGQGDQWISLGTFDFAADGNEYVQLNAIHTTEGCCKYTADAVKFVMPVNPISISNAHYYAWNDANDDGVVDNLEIYLVNFENESGNWVRKYYQFDDKNGNDEVENEELIAVDSGSVPDSIKPKIYDDTGTIVLREKTDREDLQNFANWYSFYRRRELTAKAAVARAINSMEGVQVGLYTINYYSGYHPVRQTVLPVHLDTNAIVVDNKDSAFSVSGSWSESGSPNEWQDSAYYTTTVGDSATWRPHIPQSGTYNVYAWWNCYNYRDRLAEYTIEYDGGTDTVVKNQREEGGNVCGEWVLLGTYNFAEGTSGSVSVTRRGSGGDYGSSTVADAIMFEPVSGTVNVDQTDSLLSLLYDIDSAGGTPLRDALLNVGRYYSQDDGYSGNLGDSPLAAEEDGGACQQSFTILMTDGYYNGPSPGVGNQDGGEGAPYEDNYSDTLADVAMKYYKEDLASGLPDQIPAGFCDKATWQHMVTYTVSFGVHGTLTPQDNDGDGKEDDPCFLDDSTPDPVWPQPVADSPTAVDDLWHAAVNGRGQFFSASDPDELVDALVAVLENIESRTASGSSIAANGEDLKTGAALYQAQYDPSNWSGDLLAYSVNPVTGEIQVDSPLWSAANTLQGVDASDRSIVTYDGAGAGIPFRIDELTSDQKDILDPGWTTDISTATDMLNYLRGEEIAGFRPRFRKLGDLVHSAPLLVHGALAEGDGIDNDLDGETDESGERRMGTIFVGGNDGMLHAFNAETGEERFAYIPNLLFSKLPDLTDNAYDHEFFVDLSPSAKEISDSENILIGGLGAGGKGYFALNVINAYTISGNAEATVANMVLWEYPRNGTPVAETDDLGLSYSRATIAKRNGATNEWIAVFGNGYNSNNGHAVLFILDARTGALIRRIDTGKKIGSTDDIVGHPEWISDNGLSTPSLIDVNNDGKVDYVYAGDLKGNMWKFDLTSDNTGQWSVAYNDGTEPMPLFQAGADQPITTKPDVMFHCSKPGFMVIFGTGKFLGDPDREDLSSYPTQTIYGIWDYGDDDDDSEYIGALTDRSTGALSYPSGTYLRKQVEVDFRSFMGHDLRTLSAYTANYYTEADPDSGQRENPASSSYTASYASDGEDNNHNGYVDEADEEKVHVGWFFDFPNSQADYIGERVVVDPMIRDGKAIVISFSPNQSECSGGGRSMVHEMDACNGGRLNDPVFDINNNRLVEDPNDTIIITEPDPNGGIRTIPVPPTAISYQGMLQPPKILRMDDEKREIKIFNNEGATLNTLYEAAEKRGFYYWVERN